MGEHDHHHNQNAQKRRQQNENWGGPDDVIREILLRLPIKSLLRFRAVCKKWRNMIQETNFIDQHYDISRARDAPALGITVLSNIQTLLQYLTILMLLPEGTLHTGYGGALKAWNPATCRALLLPPLSARIISRHFDLNPSTSVATLLCRYFTTYMAEHGCRILRIGIDKVWRHLTKEDALLLLSGDDDQKDLRIIRHIRHESRSVIDVYSCDTRKGRLSITYFARQGTFPANSYSLFQSGNCVACGVIGNEEFNFMVLEKQEEENYRFKWSEKVNVVPLPFLRRNPHLYNGILRATSLNANDLWFVHNEAFKFCYDMETKKIMEAGTLAVQHGPGHVVDVYSNDLWFQYSEENDELWYEWHQLRSFISGITKTCDPGHQHQSPQGGRLVKWPWTPLAISGLCCSTLITRTLQLSASRPTSSETESNGAASVTDDLLIVYVGLGSDLSEHHDHVSLGACLACSLAVTVLGKAACWCDPRLRTRR
ncbi:F-box domain containing protein [Parasponia andersonii]|uniref:F-box domain containing protein n=1 Tax=Parasponia andersonii TaxID=3476 RepID=A0A2P5BE86_PARAD|nr:F-box domain containing protein [Parasponia andersonii]